MHYGNELVDSFLMNERLLKPAVGYKLLSVELHVNLNRVL